MHLRTTIIVRALAFAAALAAFAIASWGCSGLIGARGEGTPGAGTGDSTGGPGGGGAPGGATVAGAFTCDAGKIPPSVPLRRLSREQLRNTITDLLAYAAPGDAAALAVEVAPALDAMPADARLGPDAKLARFSRLDQAVQQDHIDAGFALARSVGARLTSSPARLRAAAGACATDADSANDGACLDAFIARFGERALRRPVAADDVAFYRTPAGAPPFDAADWADVIALVLSAPDAMYLVEHGDDAAASSAGGRVPLSAYELASQLAYHFWQTMPDEALLADARSGALATDDGYAAAVDRVLADPRAARAAGEFFGQWLENVALEELDSRAGTPVFDALAGGFRAGAGLRARMLQEATDAALYALGHGGNLADVLTSRRSFARNADLASLYGVPTWSGSGEPPLFTDAARVGLITRAAYLATGSASTRPIMKGVFIRKALLCDVILPPPGNAAANPPPLSPDASTRQVVESLTGGGACATCHTALINPLGFATENFDALGRVRAAQPLYDPTTGQVVGSAPVDTRSVPLVDGSDTRASMGAADLTRMLVESPKTSACFARQYFRFTFARVEDAALDGCALRTIAETLQAGKPLAAALRALALHPSFRQRTIQ